MELSDLPESLRARMAELDAMSPIETVRKFLGGWVADAESLDEVRQELQQLARSNTRLIRRTAVAFDTFLADPPSEQGALARLVGWEANWVLSDPSDAGAERFLRELAQMLHEVLAEAD